MHLCVAGEGGCIRAVPDTYTNTHAHNDTDPSAHADTDRHSDSNFASHSVANCDTHGNSNADCDSYGNPNTDCDSYGDSNCHSQRYGDTNSDPATSGEDPDVQVQARKADDCPGPAEQGTELAGQGSRRRRVPQSDEWRGDVQVEAREDDERDRPARQGSEVARQGLDARRLPGAVIQGREAAGEAPAARDANATGAAVFLVGPPGFEPDLMEKRASDFK